MKKQCFSNAPHGKCGFLQKYTRRLDWLFLLIIVLAAAAIRVRLLAVPLERDEGEYAYTAQLMLQGIPPYSLAYNMKMPGIYAAYALLLAVFGQTQTGIHLGLLVMNALTIVLLFLLAKYLIDSLAGVFTAATFAVMSLSQSVLGIFANAEHFVILFAVAGILLFIYAIDRNSLIVLLAASCLLGIAFLMKQHAAAFILFAGIYLLVARIRRKPFEFKPLLLAGGLFVVGAVLPYGLTCFILWRAGLFEKFWFWTVTYALEYVSIVPLTDGLEILKNVILEIIRSSIPIWILAGLGLVTSFINKEVRRHVLFIVGFFLFSFLSTCPGLYFRPHYFILLLPALALVSAVGLFGIRRALLLMLNKIPANLIVVFLTVAVPLYTLYHQKDYLFESDPEIVSRMTYPFHQFPVYLKIAEYIKADTSKDDTIAVLGSEPQVLFYADRRSATGYIYVYPLMESQPYALQMQKEMIQQIETAEPKFILFINSQLSWAMWPDSNRLIVNWYKQYLRHYKLTGIVEFTQEDSVIYHWDRDAENYHSSFPYGVLVLKRND